MTPVNLYELTRVSDENFVEFEAHLSKRESLLKEKKREIDSLKAFVENISNNMEYYLFSYFYFSYSIPQISKEFDLLRIGNNYIINIELKSHIHDIETVTNQLIKNIFYLKHLEKDIFSYIYDSETDTLYQLIDNCLKKFEFHELVNKIKSQQDVFKDDINILFKPSIFLVSPLNDTEKFLKREYFLTLNQLQIREDIEKEINNNTVSFFAIKGRAGCGKTLLTYDIALNYTQYNKKVCIIHCAYLCQGHDLINSNILLLDIFPIKECFIIDYAEYDIVIIDEAQRIYKRQFEYIIGKAKENNIKVIFSYDEKQMINNTEVHNNIPDIIESLDMIKKYKLSKKIRTNPEILSFIKRLFNLTNTDEFKNYKNIHIKYANTINEAKLILNYYIINGYQFINFTPSRYYSSSFSHYQYYSLANTHNVIGQEFDNVIMFLDMHFYYDDNKLCATNHVYNQYLLKPMLMQGVTRTRNKLVLVVVDNKDLFENILSILK